MSAQLYADDRAAGPPSSLEVAPASAPAERGHPNFSGDLPTVLGAAPMFRRALVGYDRFQVDTYVQWAEQELATADREREHLLARHLRMRTVLEDARELLSRSPGGADFLQLSRRMGSMLAAAADEAESIRAEAESVRAEAHAARTAASAEAERIIAHGNQLLCDAEADAQRIVAEAIADVERRRAEADRIVAEADQTAREARAEAEARLDKVRAIEQRAVEHAERIEQRAAEEAAAARLLARDEGLRMLVTAREQRRRADAEAAATRERLDRDAAARRAALLAGVEELGHRRAAQVEQLRAQEPHTTVPAGSGRHLRAYLARFRGHLGHRVPPRGRRPSPHHPPSMSDAPR